MRFPSGLSPSVQEFHLVNRSLARDRVADCHRRLGISPTPEHASSFTRHAQVCHNGPALVPWLRQRRGSRGRHAGRAVAAAAASCPQVVDHRGRVVGAEDRGAGDEDVGAGLGAPLDRLQRTRRRRPAATGRARACRAAPGRGGSSAGTRRGTTGRRSPARPSSPAACRARAAGPRTARPGSPAAAPSRPAHPWARSSRASRTGAVAASTWKVTEPAPASTYAGAQRSGSSIIRWRSSGVVGGLAPATRRPADRASGWARSGCP